MDGRKKPLTLPTIKLLMSWLLSTSHPGSKMKWPSHISLMSTINETSKSKPKSHPLNDDYKETLKALRPSLTNDKRNIIINKQSHTLAFNNFILLMYANSVLLSARFICHHITILYTFYGNIQQNTIYKSAMLRYTPPTPLHRIDIGIESSRVEPSQLHPSFLSYLILSTRTYSKSHKMKICLVFSKHYTNSELNITSLLPPPCIPSYIK